MMRFFNKLRPGHKNDKLPPAYVDSDVAHKINKPIEKQNKPAKSKKRNADAHQASTPYISPGSSKPSQPSKPPTDDDRPLPNGWIREWNEDRKRYFYVDLMAPGGPKSHWLHPTNIVQAQNRRAAFSPPPGSPPPRKQDVPQQSQSDYPTQESTSNGYADRVNFEHGPKKTAHGHHHHEHRNHRSRRDSNSLIVPASELTAGMLLAAMMNRRDVYEERDDYEEREEYEGRDDHDERHDYNRGYERGCEHGCEHGEFFGDDFGTGHFMFR